MNIASARILIEVTGWQRFTVNGYRPRDEDVYVSYGLPGRQVARFPMRDDQTMFLFVFADAKGRCLEQPGIDHKDILRAEFGEAGSSAAEECLGPSRREPDGQGTCSRAVSWE